MRTLCFDQLMKFRILNNLQDSIDTKKIIIFGLETAERKNTVMVRKGALNLSLFWSFCPENPAVPGWACRKVTESICFFKW